MDLGIKGRVALVTASSDGIGANAARRLAQEGADIALFARSADKLASLADDLRTSYGIRVLPVAGSLIERADILRLHQEIDVTFGRLDIAVLSTGRPPNPLHLATKEDDPDRWDSAYRMLLLSLIQVCHESIALMRRGKWGRIVAVTSASVHLPMPHHALSTVFRAGVQSWIAHLSSEVGQDGITANCVAPALIASPHRSLGAAYTNEQMEKRLRMTPLGRLGTPEELSSAIAFLASEPAGFVSGATLRVDGGMGAAMPV
jgi:3-oxoacyl-[acyl-carrier protein] reductase